jgi:hypothetical protein
MSRAHPNSSPKLALLALALSVATGHGCTSDDLKAVTDGTTSTIGDDTTMGVIFTTGDVDETTTTGPGPDSETTCREALNCVINCAIALPENPPPEQEYGCFLDCEGDLSTEEWLALFAFSECLFNHCNNVTMECPDMNDEPTCLMCLVGGLGDIAPMGCEIQGQECQ